MQTKSHAKKEAMWAECSTGLSKSFVTYMTKLHVPDDGHGARDFNVHHIGLQTCFGHNSFLVECLYCVTICSKYTACFLIL